MRSYKDVVSDRYNKRVDSDFELKRTLRRMLPQLRVNEVLLDVLKTIDSQHRPLTDARILEIGCGDGRWTRFIAEVTHAPELISGTDLSKPRIEFAKRMNPAIDYQVKDVVEEPIGATYDVILALDLFMHFSTEAMIKTVLKNIHDSLSEDGIFIFIDAWARSHFEASADADSWGYNPQEIYDFAKPEEFTPLFRRTIFRHLPRKRTSEQYYGVLPDWLVRVSESMFPYPPVNFIIVFGKGKS